MNPISFKPRAPFLILPREGLYKLAAFAQMADLSADLILHYCRLGLLKPVEGRGKEDFLFDDHSLYLLRRIEHLLHVRGVNLEGTRIVIQLLQEIEKLDTELRFWRSGSNLD